MFKKLEYQKKLKREASYILIYFYKYYFKSKKYILYQNIKLKYELYTLKLKFRQSILNFKNIKLEMKKIDQNNKIIEQWVFNYELLKFELKNMNEIQLELLNSCFKLKNFLNEDKRNKKINHLK